MPGEIEGFPMYQATFLTEHFGENATTPKSLVRVLRSDTDRASVNMDETVMCCVNSDDNRLMPVNKYGIATVMLPDWLTAEEYLVNQIGWDYTWGRGCSKEWPENWNRALFSMRDRAERIAICEMLAVKNFRSEFRKSLRDQVVQWFEAIDRKYDMPLSSGQMKCIVNIHHVRAAKQAVSLQPVHVVR